MLEIFKIMEVHCSLLKAHQKRAPEHITDGWEPPCGCWDFNAAIIPVLEA